MADSQSVPTAPMVSESVGTDGGKKVKGRKRHILVDRLGLLLVVVLAAANVSEGAGLRRLLERANELEIDLTRLWKIVVDGGYVGEKLVRWVMDSWGWILEKVLRPEERRGFCLVPKRWVVERTFGWFRWCRRCGRDYERKPETAESWLYIASIRLLLRRLT